MHLFGLLLSIRKILTFCSNVVYVLCSLRFNSSLCLNKLLMERCLEQSVVFALLLTSN
jgi:hypothetical protein